MARRSTTFVVLLLIPLLVVAGSTSFAASVPSIDADPSFETPSKTVAISGTEYPVSSLGYTDAGDALTYTVSDVDASVFTVHLYDSDKNIEDSKRYEETGSYTFDTAGLDPGTYVLALSIDGSIEAIQPVVISGYEFVVDAPSEQSAEDPVVIDIELTSTSGTPNRVEIAVMNESAQRNYVASKIDDGTYNVVVPDLDAGEYRLYAGTRGTDEIDGRDELTGISSIQTLTLNGSQTTTTTTTTSTSDDTDGTSTTESSATTTATTATTTLVNTTPTSTSDGTNSTTTTTTNAGPSTTNATMTPGNTTNTTTVTTTTATTTTAIQPASTTQPPTATEAPGFSILSAITAILALLLIGRREG